VKRRAELTTEQDQLILGMALRSLRNDAGLTQEQLAERLKVDPTFVGRLERGQRGAHWRTIRRILAALDTTVARFASAIERAERDARR
jgi:XRE family transcriptional regulator, regulator of sulfur utilization